MRLETGWGGEGVDLQYSTYPCRNPYKVNYSLHKRRYFGRVFEASEGKCEASEEHQHRRACLSLHARLAHAFDRLTKGEKKKKTPVMKAKLNPAHRH